MACVRIEIRFRVNHDVVISSIPSRSHKQHLSLPHIDVNENTAHTEGLSAEAASLTMQSKLQPEEGGVPSQRGTSRQSPHLVGPKRYGVLIASCVTALTRVTMTGS